MFMTNQPLKKRNHFEIDKNIKKSLKITLFWTTTCPHVKGLIVEIFSCHNILEFHLEGPIAAIKRKNVISHLATFTTYGSDGSTYYKKMLGEGKHA